MLEYFIKCRYVKIWGEIFLASYTNQANTHSKHDNTQ